MGNIGKIYKNIMNKYQKCIIYCALFTETAVPILSPICGELCEGHKQPDTLEKEAPTFYNTISIYGNGATATIRTSSVAGLLWA